MRPLICKTWNTFTSILTLTEITSTYTSPSGVNYTVKLRANSGFDEWNIYRDGIWVQFALSEEGVANSVAHYENPGPDRGSRFD